MRITSAILFSISFLCTVVFIFSAALVPAQEMTTEELAAAYEKTFAKLQSWDISYASGHISNWDDWKFTGNQQHRWRKSGKIERAEMTKRIGSESVPISVHYTDGTKQWWLRGDSDKAEGIDLLDQKGLHAEINLMTDVVFSAFPYHNFTFTLSIADRIVDDSMYGSTYSIAQILKDFRTKIIDRRQDGNATIITTRSYLPSAEKNSKHFIQLSFDSSVGYLPKQVVYPRRIVSGKIGEEEIPAEPFYYTVNNFIEYHTSEDGAFFPVKISTCRTDDINKLDNLTITGKVAVSAINLNQPVDIPEIVFPPGVIVIVTEPETEKLTSYIWGENNKPLKVLTQADYDAAEREKLMRVKK